LLIGAGWREIWGLTLLGLAFAWAFGSASRILRLCLGLAGVFLMLYPVASGRIDRYQSQHEYNQKLGEFEKRLPEFAREHPDLSAGLVSKPITGLPPGAVVVPVTRTVPVPNVGRIRFPVDMSDKEIAEALRGSNDRGQPPQWYFDALNAGVDAEMISKLDTPRQTVRTPSVMETIESGFLEESIGAALVLLFLGSLVAENRHRAVG